MTRPVELDDSELPRIGKKPMHGSDTNFVDTGFGGIA